MKVIGFCENKNKRLNEFAELLPQEIHVISAISDSAVLNCFLLDDLGLSKSEKNAYQFFLTTTII